MERVTEYFAQLLDITRNNSWVRNEELTFREIDEKEGYIRGTLALHGGYTLHIAEYVHIIQGHPECIKYLHLLLCEFSGAFFTERSFHIGIPGST